APDAAAGAVAGRTPVAAVVPACVGWAEHRPRRSRRPEAAPQAPAPELFGSLGLSSFCPPSPTSASRVSSSPQTSPGRLLSLSSSSNIRPQQGWRRRLTCDSKTLRFDERSLPHPIWYMWSLET